MCTIRTRGLRRLGKQVAQVLLIVHPRAQVVLKARYRLHQAPLLSNRNRWAWRRGGRTDDESDRRDRAWPNTVGESKINLDSTGDQSRSRAGIGHFRRKSGNRGCYGRHCHCRCSGRMRR